MTKTKLLCACLLSSFVLVATACKKDKPAEPAAASATTESPAAAKPAEPAVAAPAPAAAGGAVDQSDPVKVTEAIFAAAASGSDATLAGLCAEGKGDGDVKSICGAKAGDAKWKEFTEYFAKGKVDGAARVEGDSAEVDFLFGPDGTKKETMKLEKVDGKWVLSSF